MPLNALAHLVKADYEKLTAVVKTSGRNDAVGGKSPSFRGTRQREPQMCNCTSGNLEIPGSMLRIAPE